ncbi:MAG TPA: L,D-transpeptidase, partial [Actinomycetota bacterium]|nr:L,D-transpeptidase [Actinomycetota bacterium]
SSATTPTRSWTPSRPTPNGSFSTKLVLDRTTRIRAVWGDVVSDAVTVKVRAIVTARMSTVRLFDVVRVRGTVGPALAGGTVDVTLLRSGRRDQTKQARIGSAGGYSVGFRIMHPGTYRARASFSDADHLRGAATTSADATPLPRLRSGSRSVFVRLLEARLSELHYRIVGIDQTYDHRTGDAVVAFRKVQGMAREFTVTESVWRRLADPRIPRARLDMRRFHIEVDQTRQVLYTVLDRRVTNVIHVSTGAGGATNDGRFRVYRKLAGFSANRLYYPSYFDGLRAIHGWTEVPTYPASHGCVRVPYWHARWIFGLADIGTRVAVYHS